MMKKPLIIMLILAAVTIGAQAQSYKSAIGLQARRPYGSYIQDIHIENKRN